MYSSKIILSVYQCSMLGTAFFLFSWPTNPTDWKHIERGYFTAVDWPWNKQINAYHMLNYLRICSLPMVLRCEISAPLFWFVENHKDKSVLFHGKVTVCSGSTCYSIAHWTFFLNQNIWITKCWYFSGFYSLMLLLSFINRRFVATLQVP